MVCAWVLTIYPILLLLLVSPPSGYSAYHTRADNPAGPLVRIGPNEVISTDPEVLRMMSAVRSPYTKGLFYETGRIIPGEETVVSLRDEYAHKTLRAKMGTAVCLSYFLVFNPSCSWTPL